MSQIITPRRDLILPSRYKQRGFIMNPYRFGSGGGGSGEAAYKAEVLADSPVWFGRHAEASGTTAINQTGGASGTYGANTALNQSPLYTGGLNSASFVAAPAHCAIPASVLTSATALTLECIIKPAALGGIRHIISRDTNVGDRRLWQWRINGTSVEFIRIVGGVSSVTASMPALAVGTTCLLGVTIDAGGGVVFYLNGAAAGTGSVGAANYGHASETICVGSRPAGEYFGGYVAESAVYPSALSAARMLAHAQAAGFA